MRIINKFLISALILISNIINLGQPVEIEHNSFLITINNDQPYTEINQNDIININDFHSFTDPSKAGQYKLPSKSILLAIPPNSDPIVEVRSYHKSKMKNAIPAIQPEVKLINDSTLLYQKIENTELLNHELNKPIVELGKRFWLRDFYCIEVIINSHQFDPSNKTIIEYSNIEFQLKFENSYNFLPKSKLKVKSEYDKQLIKYLFNSNIAEQFRVKNLSNLISDSTGNWINYDANYLKIAVGENSIYRITKEDLENFGISTFGIDPQTFQLYESGAEYPIHVNGESDGSFDETDYIEFVGIKNYPKISHHIINDIESPYNEYLNRYTDTTYFFLTWGDIFGNRCEVELETFTSSDTLDYQIATLHYETNAMFQNLNNDEIANQTPNWTKNKSWYRQWIFTGRRNFSFFINALYPNKKSYAYFKAVSAGSNISNNSHQVKLLVNSIQIDSQSVNRFDQALLQGELNSNQLVNGSNQISVINLENGTVPNWFAMDWYEIKYPKYLKAVNDSLIFELEAEYEDSPVIIKIEDVIGTVFSIYKYQPEIKKFSNYSVFGNALYIYDTVSTGDKYIIKSDASFKKPELIYSKQFVNLRDGSQQADYLAITHPKFADAAMDYSNIISGVYGVVSKTINVFDIYDEFGFGYPTPESIKLFLQTAFQNWESPKISYAALIGDATYDYKGYIFQNVGVRLSYNYVPSYGNPIGDYWYSVWDDATYIPQIQIGRIPITEISQLDYYKSKVLNNIDAPFTIWNKKYMFFSGGSGSSPSELAQLKAVNDSIISHTIDPRPVSGDYMHFYKTADPVTDFGPYTSEEIENAISDGALFISYIGHSGTATWDNSINETVQLENDVNRNPLITDFGCSTNKFGEPDIISFGERFLLNTTGQAIGYVGNSSLGFVSTATSVPQLFYDGLINDSLHSVGNAHLYAKMKLFERFGSSGVNKVFTLTNILLGDPLVRIRIPNKPNLNINSESISLPENISEELDSISVKLYINNFGSSPVDTFSVAVQHSFNSEVINDFSRKLIIPELTDSIMFFVITKEFPGEHKILVKLDSENTIDELDESDNEYEFTFNVFSVSLRDLYPYQVESGIESPLILLNPTTGKISTISITSHFSSDEEFSVFTELISELTSFYSTVDIPIELLNNRIWYRQKLGFADAQFSQVKSFVREPNFEFSVKDSIAFKKQNNNNISFSSSNGLSLSENFVNISVLSAGYYAGRTCVIAKDGQSLLGESFFAGMGIAVFDESTMDLDTAQYYQLWDNPSNADLLTELINSIEPGKVVVMGVADDGRNQLDADLKNAIKTLGSTKIDSLVFRGSWAIIGKKGAAPGDVIEVVKDPYSGSIFIDSTYIAQNITGSMLTRTIGPAVEWNSFKIVDNQPSNSSINYTPILISKEGIEDTLTSFNPTDSIYDISSYNAAHYPYLKLLADFEMSDDNQSPSLQKFGVNYLRPSELGTNYQVVSTDKDSIYQGDDIFLNFYVYNAGEAMADSVNVAVNVAKFDKKMTIMDTLLTSIESLGRRPLRAMYRSSFEDGYGPMAFEINIDSENKILELYEDNNFFRQNFYVVKDTTTPFNTAEVEVLFDGINILDGEFVSNSPQIKIDLVYQPGFPYDDTTAVNFTLDGKTVYKSQIDSIKFDTINRRVSYIFNPTLTAQEHYLEVRGNSFLGSSNLTEYSRLFNVSNEVKLLDVYNFPNPFINDTYFTFRLTQLPDDLSIRIFTVAGRLIKEIELLSTDLNHDLNRIYWDGKDADGDIIANGVYIYKITAVKGDKAESVTSKLAVVK